MKILKLKICSFFSSLISKSSLVAQQPQPVNSDFIFSRLDDSSISINSRGFIDNHSIVFYKSQESIDNLSNISGDTFD